MDAAGADEPGLSTAPELDELPHVRCRRGCAGLRPPAAARGCAGQAAGILGSSELHSSDARHGRAEPILLQRAAEGAGRIPGELLADHQQTTGNPTRLLSPGCFRVW